MSDNEIVVEFAKRLVLHLKKAAKQYTNTPSTLLGKPLANKSLLGCQQHVIIADKIRKLKHSIENDSSRDLAKNILQLFPEHDNIYSILSFKYSDLYDLAHD